MNGEKQTVYNSSADTLETLLRLPETSGCSGGWCQIGITPDFEWNCYRLPVRNLSPALRGCRILHLSDMHLQPAWSKGYERLLRQLREAPPDLILITGDFVDHKLDHRKALPYLERFLTQLSSRHGIYAILGNHDGDLLGARHAGMGVNPVERSFIQIPIGNATIELIGLPGVKRRDFNPDDVAAVPPRAEGVARIILGHYPDQVRFVSSLCADAMLVGHTHGGQICLPNRHALLTHDRLPRRMARGIHRFGETLLFVNRGFGTTKWPIRIFCPAEVIELRLE